MDFCSSWPLSTLIAIPHGSSLDSKRKRLTSIPGQVPQLHNRPVGCNFADRCPRASHRCKENEPLETLKGKNNAFIPLFKKTDTSCSFLDRCNRSTATCVKSMPELLENQGHLVACFNVG